MIIRNLLMLAAVLSVSANALAYDFGVDGIYYNILSEYDKTVEVVSYYNSYSGDVVIPEQVQYNEELYSVTSIGNGAFEDCSSLTSVTIPESVTSIGNRAFEDCSSLASVTIPEGVTSIGGSAFFGCSSLASVAIPKGVTFIGGGAFSGCSSLASVTIPEGVTSIGNNAFRDCSGLASVTIPESVTSIGEFAFYGCSGLTSVTIPESVTSIGDYAFSYCSSLASVTIPESVTSIGGRAFSGCSSLASVTIPNSVTSIGNHAFSACRSLKDLTIEDGEKTLSLGYNYYSSYGIGDGLFADCPLETVYLGRNLSYSYDSRDGYSPFYNTPIKELTIGNCVTSIGNHAFDGCSGLASVTIPEGVTSIGDSAFDGCSSLTSVNISDLSAWCRIDFEGYRANPLDYAHNLYLNGALVTDLVIPEDVSEIKSYAFLGGSCVTSVTIPEGVTSIGGSAFNGCSSLTSVNISDLSAWSKIDFESYGANPLGYAHNLYLNGALVTDLVIPKDISEIKPYAFLGGSCITSVTIPEGVTSIGDYAFDGCSSLASVTIGVGIRSIADNAFNATDVKKAIWLSDTPPDSYYEFAEINYVCNDSYRFSNQVVCLLNTMKEINGVRYVPTGESEAAYDVIDYIGNETVITIEEDMNVINIGPYAFYDCRGLSSVSIPNSVTTIGGEAFNGCSGLTSLTIGSGVLSIDTNAFSSTNLKKVVWLPNTPPDGYENVSSARNYVSNDSYNGLDNVTVYPYLSSMFEAGGLKYVPVSPSERTCDAIDCSYNNTAENIAIGKTVNYRGIEMTLLDVKDYVCYGNDSIKTLQIKEYAGNIGESSFYGCSNLETVNINDMIGSIGDEAFYGCGNLKTVDIQNLEGNIGESSFYSCGNLETVNISDMVGSIGNDVFYDCSNIKAVDIQNLAGNIGESSFYGCSNLETVNISDMRGNIGDKAFYDCASLKGIEIPNTVAGIGKSCFSGCSSLEYATIGSEISLLPESCFRGCSSLPEIVIPSTVGRVGNNVFYGCSALTRVDIANRQTELSLGYNSEYSNIDKRPLFSDCPLDSVYIGGNISYGTGSGSGYSPFYRNTSLRAVKITDQETEISENEFYGCTGLERVELGDGIESIGNYAFSGCSALESFTFGNSLATIGNEAFSDCTAMTRLVSKTEVPPVCGSQALDDINKWTCELFVPQKSLEAYKAAEQWKEFFFIKGDDSGESGGIDNIGAKEEISVISRNGYIEITGVENQEVEVYNLSGQLVYGGTETTINVPAKGIYIVKVAGQTFKVAL